MNVPARVSSGALLGLTGAGTEVELELERVPWIDGS